MIIKCNNCNKSFDIDSNLIPEKGRLLQCVACNHKWFFKSEIIKRPFPIDEIKAFVEEPVSSREDMQQEVTETQKTIELLDAVNKELPLIEKISIEKNDEKKIIRKDKEPNAKLSINKKSYTILGLIIVFIISFIAIIIVLDTFQKPISMFVPNIEFILYNLYETISDIVLFFSDLIL